MDADVKIVWVLPLPCGHLYRLTSDREIRPIVEGWNIETFCHCGKRWKFVSRKGALNAEPL